MRLFFYTTVLGLLFLVPNLNGQCLDWVSPSDSTGWIDFNLTFGGAPCNDEFYEIDAFEVYASEAYSIDNFVAGGEYTFSMCNGAGAGNWVPEFTIIAPSGAVDAFGAGDGDGCSITWTASEDGTYLIVINEADNCGVAMNTDNGFPALACNSGVPCSPPDTLCSSGILATAGVFSICEEGGEFTIETDGSEDIPAGGGYGWSFDNSIGGTGGPNGGFTLTNSSPSSTFDAGLNGVLAANSLPDLEGGWVLFGFVYTDNAFPIDSVCSTTTDSMTVFFGTESPSVDEVSDNGDNTATVTASGGVMPYTYEWSDGQTTETAIDLTPGNYTVTVTDAYGCTGEGSVEIVGVAVNEIAALEAATISPNPTGGLLNLSLAFRHSVDVTTRIFDITGKVQLSRHFQNMNAINEALDLSKLPEGLYLLQFTVGNEQFTRRVVVSR